MICVGSSLIGSGVALQVAADLGLGPYDAMLSAVSGRTGLSLGQSSWVASAVFFTVAALLGRPPAALGVVFIVGNGIAVDTASELVRSPDTLLLRWMFVVGGLTLIALGITLVVQAAATGGAFELLMMAAEDRGIGRYRTRTALEVGVLCLGVVGGGSFGPATVVIALTVGPVLRRWNQVVTDHSAGRQARLTLANSEAGVVHLGEASGDHSEPNDDRAEDDADLVVGWFQA